MKLTLLSRLVLSYFFLFILVISFSVFAIVRIGQFNEVIRAELLTNSQILDSTRRLTDASLSLIRFEKKFLITKDDALYQEFLQLGKDFDQSLGHLRSLADSSQVKSLLTEIEASFQRYRSLFAEESQKLRAGQTYSVLRYKDEKERVSNAILEKLDQLRAYTQQDTDEEIRKLYAATIEARKITIGMTATFLVLAIAVSFFINHSITKPLSVLKKKTGEISKGIFRGDLNLSSPPEIGDLASAINVMCDKLNELDEMKSDFFSSISHEFRTPLTTLKMGLRLLKEQVGRGTPEDQNYLLTSLEGETDRLVGLVNSLLDLSKMEAGMMIYHLEAKSLSPLFDQVLMEMEPLLSGKRIAISKQISGELPVLRIDAERILQTLRNLISNAAKFTPEGGQVRISAKPVEKGVEVSVSDTGPGIPEEMLTTIFEKFRQSTSKSSLPMGGTGLGLAIAKQVVTSHGGKIWAESEPGRGSTFIFVLPT